MAKPVILVVDDEEDIRELVELNLSREGYTVLSCQTGEQALQQAAVAATQLRCHSSAMTGRPERMVFNASFLLAPDALPEFRRVLAEQQMYDKKMGLSLELRGPWPPAAAAAAAALSLSALVIAPNFAFQAYGYWRLCTAEGGAASAAPENVTIWPHAVLLLNPFAAITGDAIELLDATFHHTVMRSDPWSL